MPENENKTDVNGEETQALVDQNKLEVEAENTKNDEKDTSENKVLKFIQSIIPTVAIAIGSFILVLLLHFLGAFDIMELKLYDLRFKIRGPISGMDSNSALPSPEEFVDLTEPFNDANGNGNWDKEESYSDVNENKKYDPDELNNLE